MANPNGHGGKRAGAGKKTEKPIQPVETVDFQAIFGNLPEADARQLWEAHLALAKGYWQVLKGRRGGTAPPGMVHEEWIAAAADELCETCAGKLETLHAYSIPPSEKALKDIEDRIAGKAQSVPVAPPQTTFIYNSPLPGRGRKTYQVGVPEPIEEPEASAEGTEKLAFKGTGDENAPAPAVSEEHEA